MLEALARPVRGQERDAWLYITYSFGHSFSVGFLQVLLGLYVLSIGFSESFLATQELVIALSSASFSLLASVVIDRFGTKVALLLSAVATILGRFLLVAYPSRPAMLGASVVVACGIAFYWVSQGVVLAQVSSGEQRARLFGLNWTVFNAGAFLGGVVAGSLPSLLGPLLDARAESAQAYRYTMWTGVGVMLLTSLTLVWIRTGKRGAAVGEPRGVWKVEEPGKVARLLIPVATPALATGLTLPFLSIFLDGTFGASDRSIGFIYGMFALIGSLGG